MNYLNLLGDFRPALRCIMPGSWRATIGLPVVGEVSVTANSWQEAKMSLWLISQAVEMLAAKQCKQPSEWTEDEWRRTLGTMRDVMSSNATSSPTAADRLGEAMKLTNQNAHP